MVKDFKAFLLGSGTRKGCLFLPLLSYIVLEILTRAKKQEREIKGMQTGKKDVKSYVFTNDMIFYTENTVVLPQFKKKGIS